MVHYYGLKVTVNYVEFSVSVFHSLLTAQPLCSLCFLGTRSPSGKVVKTSDSTVCISKSRTVI